MECVFLAVIFVVALVISWGMLLYLNGSGRGDYYDDKDE